MFTSPSVDYRACVRQYSNGKRGVIETLAVMRSLVQEGRIDLDVRAAAVSAIYLAPERDEPAEVRALYYLVRDTIRYVRDIHEVETISTPAKVLRARVGDCDDQSVLLASLLESVGYPTRFVAAGYGDAGEYTHVYVQVFIGEWVDLDPTEPGDVGVTSALPTTVLIEGG